MLIDKVIQLHHAAQHLNAELAHIHTDGKNATIKVIAQHITTKQIVIHENFEKDDIIKAIKKAIQETGAVTNSRT